MKTTKLYDSKGDARVRRDESRPRRSALFLRGDNLYHHERAVKSATDIVLFDLEGTVPMQHKEAARAGVRKALTELDFHGKEKAVRVNPITSDMWYEDLLAVVEVKPDLLVLSWTQTGEEMRIFDAVLTAMEKKHGIPVGHIRLMPLIEVIQGVANVEEIAEATPRVSGLMFGSGDYTHDTDGISGEEENVRLLFARMRILTAARVAGIDAIDTPYMINREYGHRDMEGFERVCKHVRGLGFDGKACFTPAQAEIANRVFSPTAEEVEEAVSSERIHEMRGREQTTDEAVLGIAPGYVGVQEGYRAAHTAPASEVLRRARRAGVI